MLGPPEEVIDERHLRPCQAGDEAALGANQRGEIAVDRVIVAHVLGCAQEPDVAAEAGEILPELGIDAAGRALPLSSVL